jgi:hypothetical protein
MHFPVVSKNHQGRASRKEHGMTTMTVAGGGGNLFNELVHVKQARAGSEPTSGYVPYSNVSIASP